MEIILKYFADFTGEQVRQFQLLETLYKEWNEQINVISRKDIDSLYEKHVLHSLSIAATFDFTDGMNIIDLGTGGGFPGIPLAIFFPQIQFHLVDSIAKKLKVVEAVAAGIGLQNITTQHSRIEDIRNRPQDPVGKFDFVVSRAVAPLKDLWRWSKPLLKIKTQTEFTPGLICLKGGDLATEIQESGVKPKIMDILSIFSEDFFNEKYLVYVSR
ncbi:MAG: 16S rRNA (guanine(527)-N(7))-methyltransferase RsmG [Bacteroidota bacterium]|nr:16S rRNA (guanine(527)-N(7))-methyltransferase RsmG [Bacteroidota bacterium]